MTDKTDKFDAMVKKEVDEFIEGLNIGLTDSLNGVIRHAFSCGFAKGFEGCLKFTYSNREPMP